MCSEQYRTKILILIHPLHFVKTLQCVSFLLLTLNAWAAPYIPEHKDTVVETLPTSLMAAYATLRQERAHLSLAKNEADLNANLATSIQLARQYIATAQSESDPRWYGYAQASLSPWWQDAHASADVRLLKAMILQHNHRFDEALRELDIIIAGRSNLNGASQSTGAQSGQAHLVRAAIYLVKNAYGAARQDCESLVQVASALVTVDCIAQVDSLTGKARASYARLFQVLQFQFLNQQSNTTSNTTSITTTNIRTEEQFSAVLTLATIAHRLGDYALAENHYKQALSFHPNNDFALLHYADLLSEQKKFHAVQELISPSAQHLGLQTRLLEACMALHDQAASASNRRDSNRSKSKCPVQNECNCFVPEFIKAQRENLQEQFSLAMQRDELRPDKDFARFALHILHEPKVALSAALANWQLQREPEDALLLLQTALAAKDGSQITAVANWLNLSGLEDQRFQRELTEAAQNYSNMDRVIKELL